MTSKWTFINRLINNQLIEYPFWGSTTRAPFVNVLAWSSRSRQGGVWDRNAFRCFLKIGVHAVGLSFGQVLYCFFLESICWLRCVISQICSTLGHLGNEGGTKANCQGKKHYLLGSDFICCSWFYFCELPGVPGDVIFATILHFRILFVGGGIFDLTDSTPF